jgi:hypothetical protein
MGSMSICRHSLFLLFLLTVNPTSANVSLSPESTGTKQSQRNEQNKQDGKEGWITEGWRRNQRAV